MDQRQLFEEKLIELLASKRLDNSSSLSRDFYNEVIASMQDINLKKPKTDRDYKRMAKYQVFSVCGTEKLIRPLKKPDDLILYFAANDELFDILHDVHVLVGHGGRNRMNAEIRKKYCNVPKDIILLYLSLCTTCKRKQSLQTKGYVTNPIISNDFNSRGQVDLIDMQAQSCRGYKFIMVYQDHLTKFSILTALKTKSAEEIAVRLLKNFAIIGAPAILHTDNGGEFRNQIVPELCKLWDGIKIVHGKPRHSQSQGSVERANQDIEKILGAWMVENNCTDWPSGLDIVQIQKNSAYHSGIKRSPYEALYGCPTRRGLVSTSLPKSVLAKMQTEEDLEEALMCYSRATTLIQPDHEESVDTPCVICNNPADGAHTCGQCGEVVHAICGKTIEEDEGYGSKVLCFLCDKSKTCKRTREDCRENLIKQAKRMKQSSDKKHKLVSIGDTVMIPVPKVDRARTDFPNIIGLVMNIENEDYYRIGTKAGLLRQLFSRSQFDVCSQKLLEKKDIDVTKEIGIREAAAAMSIVGGQGIKKCNCTTKCQTKRCICRAKNLLCNSRCHSSLSCCNK